MRHLCAVISGALASRTSTWGRSRSRPTRRTWWLPCRVQDSGTGLPKPSPPASITASAALRLDMVTCVAVVASGPGSASGSPGCSTTCSMWRTQPYREHLSISSSIRVGRTGQPCTQRTPRVGFHASSPPRRCHTEQTAQCRVRSRLSAWKAQLVPVTVRTGQIDFTRQSAGHASRESRPGIGPPGQSRPVRAGSTRCAAARRGGKDGTGIATRASHA